MKNKTNFLEKLLDDASVEWKPLGAVLVRTKGTKITATEMRVIHKQDAPLKIFAGGKTVAFVDFEDIPAKDINRKPSIIVKSRGVIEFEYYEKPFSHKNEMWSYHSNNEYLDIKFVYYFLKINEPYFQNIGGKMQMPQISTPDTEKFKIPIPCPDNPKKSLEIQQKIVRILNTFSELTARKKQYNYYRETLLSFGEGEVAWKSLGEVCLSISAGGDVPENSIKGQTIPSDEYPYPIYANATGEGGLYGFTDEYKIESDAVTISARGAKIGYHTIREGKFTPIIRLISLVSNKNIISTKFLNYILYKTAIGGNDGGIPQLTVPTVKKLRIPVPSKEEQERIVAILDKFDILTTSISEGLPKEIELRKRQYEYYRDLLLTFPKDNLES